MIQFNSLSFGYTKKHELFNQLDISILSGKIYGLLGKNGTGKTTLLKLMCGLVAPLSGSIRVGDFEPFKRQPEFLSQVYLLPEDIFLPARSASELVKLYAPFYPLFKKQQFLQLLAMFEMQYESDISKLSFGQQKKVMIAFALACNTSYLLLDEPTNGLDIPSKVVFRKLIASVFDEKRTIIISTHQVRDLDSLIDHVIILNNNKIQIDSSIEHIATKYRFVHSSGQPDGKVLYSCNSVLGKSYILTNYEQTQGQVDIETYFNAVNEFPDIFATSKTSNV